MTNPLVRFVHSMGLVTLVAVTAIVAPSLGQADTTVMVEGQIQAFDENSVILENNGAKLKIPRRWISNSKVQSGRRVHFQLDSKEDLELFFQAAKSRRVRLG